MKCGLLAAEIRDERTMLVKMCPFDCFGFDNYLVMTLSNKIS
jgi:hypothetical protein